MPARVPTNSFWRGLTPPLHEGIHESQKTKVNLSDENFLKHLMQRSKFYEN
jgi:hypothetical protein